MATSDGVDAQLPAKDQPAQPGWHPDEELRPLEEEMVAAAAAGKLVDRGEGPFSLAEMETWGEERTIRAAVLRHLLVADKWPAHVKGVRLRGVRISGHLDLEEAALRCSLSLDYCFLKGDVPACLDHATALGLTLTGCQLAGLTGEMLTAREVDLSGSTLTGPLDLRGAEITGQLICSGTTLTGRSNDGDALIAYRMKAMGVFLDEGFTTTGAVLLTSAEIADQLICSGATLTGRNNDGDALIADRMKATGVSLDEGFTTTTGAVRLAAAEIASQLICRDATLTGRNNDGDALIADRMKAKEMYVDGKFTAAGAVQLPGAQISGTLAWLPTAPVSEDVNLERATVGHLWDYWTDKRPNGYWPVGRRLHLDGFTYGRFSGDRQATVEQRLAWIRSQYEPRTANRPTAFATQPYEQLAAVYRQAGQDDQARKVAIARRADQRKYGRLNPYRWLGNWFLDWTIKYGYQTWRAAAGLAVVFVAFLVLSFLAQQHHLMVPVGDTDGLHYLPSATKCTSDYPCFYPLGYTIDTVIPIINVHQADNWGPYGPPPWGYAWIVGTYVATGLGWALATLLVAGYTGLVRQD